MACVLQRLWAPCACLQSHQQAISDAHPGKGCDVCCVLVGYEAGQRLLLATHALMRQLQAQQCYWGTSS